MLDKQQSLLGKHATTEKHEGQSPSHVLTSCLLFTDTKTWQNWLREILGLSHFSVVLWFPGSLWS